MLYILPEIDCIYSLKHIFQGEMSHFQPLYNKILIESQIIGLQILHPLALYRIASSNNVS